MERRNVTITEQQAKWLEENHIKLSALVRDKIDEEMKRKGVKS